MTPGPGLGMADLQGAKKRHRRETFMRILFLGALLAVPLTASVKVLFRRYIWERKLEPAVEERLGPIPERPKRGESPPKEASVEAGEESGDEAK